MLFLVILLYIILANPTFPKVKSNKAVDSVYKVLTIESTAQELLLQIDDIQVLNNDEILLADNLDLSIKIYSKEGLLKKKLTNNEIKDPNYKFPFKIAKSDNYLAVVGYNTPYVFILSSEYKYLRTIKTKGLIFNIGFDKEENIWIGVNTGIKYFTLFKYSINGTILDTIPLKYSKGSLLHDFFNFVITSEGYVIVTYIYHNKIEIWETNGKFVREFSIKDMPTWPEYIDTEDIKVPKGILIGSIAYLNKELYLLGGHYTENRFKDVYVYNILGEFIKKLNLPNAASKIYVTKGVFLYAIENRKTRVSKYKILD